MDIHLSNFQINALIGLTLYFGVMILIGIRSAKKETSDGFIIGSRNVGLIPTIASVATGFRDGTGAVFWFGMGLGAAYEVLWFFPGLALACMIFVIYGWKIRQIAAKHNFITVGQLVRHYIGPKTEKFVALIILFVSLILVGVQLHVSGHIFAKILQLDSAYGIISVASVVGIYMFFGGYSTVIKTDYLQFFVILSLFSFLIFFPPSAADMMDFSGFITPNINIAIGVFILGLLYMLSSAETWQRVFSAKSKTVVQRSFILATPFLILMTLALVWVGMGTKHLFPPNTEQGDALFMLFTFTDQIPAMLLAFFAIVIMSITMSTLDSMCYSFTSTLTKNILPAQYSDTRAGYIRISRILIVGILVSMSVLAINISDVITIAFSAASYAYVLAPLYVFLAAGVYKPSASQDNFIIITLAIVSVVFFYMFSNNMFEDLMLTGIPALLMFLLLTPYIVIQKLRGTNNKV